MLFAEPGKRSLAHFFIAMTNLHHCRCGFAMPGQVAECLNEVLEFLVTMVLFAQPLAETLDAIAQQWRTRPGADGKSMVVIFYEKCP